MAVGNTRRYRLHSDKARPGVDLDYGRKCPGSGFVVPGEQHRISFDGCVDLGCRHVDEWYGNVDPGYQQNGYSDENAPVHPDYASGCRMVCVFAGRAGS
ncbi:MAG: hypothetical protein N0C90_16140 [Candidatus Thiodiazotropha endolucinida]|nr:hypothetical protein [Candidatus Thiodiazotropha taylori]MCW4262889.1 hypothetical protein [Candidatus Thiodiazotropha endolucinida]